MKTLVQITKKNSLSINSSHEKDVNHRMRERREWE